MGRAREEGGIKHGHELSDLRLYTPAGKTVTLGTVASVEMESGPEQINHIERERSLTIQLQPPESMPLGEAIDVIESQIVAPIREAGRLSPHERIHLSGAADALSQALRSFRWNFLLALVITYLLMSALFENFLYPLVIMFSVPLAALGGFAGLRLVHAFVPTQGLDLLTMLGFVILVGTVVNNAILVVHQTLIGMRERGLDTRGALLDAVRIRVRPIFMSMATSVFGMLPLVLSPGAGSEIYRGLGSVVIGGLLVSTVFTLFLIPALFSLVLEAYEALPGIIQKIRQKKPSAS
jgi:HAE1 family hydrophobic/amphiphilic exporter-1